MDGGSGGATPPNDVSSFNTSYSSFHYDGGQSFRETILASGDNNDGQLLTHLEGLYSSVGSGPHGPSSISGSYRLVEWTAQNFPYNLSLYKYSDSALLGLAGHNWLELNYTGYKLSQFYYYYHGYFDLNANMFVLN